VSLATIYFLFFAAERFESETRFVVRSPSNTTASQLASLMQGSSIVRSSDDAFIVHAYLGSRDIVRRLVGSGDLRERLDRPEADFLWRYPGPLRGHNEERLHRHMQWMTKVDYDFTTGITSLRVQAFRPEDAQALAEAMLKESELLINRLSERARTDAIAAAEREVESTRANARAAHGRITEFRNRVGMIDPNRVSVSALETISRLTLDMALTNAQLSEIAKSSPQSTQIGSLRNRISALDAQVRIEQQTLAGTSTSLAPLIADYERLTLEREFAERTFASALTSLEAARLDTQRQRLFLERISNPNSPDYARYPYKFLGILAVFAACMMIYGIGRRVFSDTVDHAGR
jgi:capsular polysaccharide transport system permease protein